MLQTRPGVRLGSEDRREWGLWLGLLLTQNINQKMMVSSLPPAFLLWRCTDFWQSWPPGELTSRPGQRRLGLQAPAFSGSPAPSSTHTSTLELPCKATVLQFRTCYLDLKSRIEALKLLFCWCEGHQSESVLFFRAQKFPTFDFFVDKLLKNAHANYLPVSRVWERLLYDILASSSFRIWSWKYFII